MEKLDDLLHHFGNNTRFSTAVVQAADSIVLSTVKRALQLNLGTYRLYGNLVEIKEIAEEAGLDLNDSRLDVIHAPSAQDAAEQAVKDVRLGHAGILMKGSIQTADFLKAVLNKQNGIRSGKFLSHTALFELPGYEKLLFLTDSAINITPGLEEKTVILENAVKVANSVGIKKPKIAVLAAIESVNPTMPATIDAACLTQMQNRGQLGNCLVDGPMAFDVAVSKEAAAQKKVASHVAGDADILLAPTLEAGNSLYKSFVYFAKAKVAGIISGAQAPIVLVSRSDSAENRLYSLALAIRTTI
ncbi:bifunctional enoyl-CoA hydratase/phosphate acetyltransferase [Sediminibacillus massiliensis]|uniref:bifunctional enoyl-CoA hydratase/phosphate acetyltransferase n=1 Tax=Sediminibacillus massiliensis TaxID=1926277 RepID=UPI00098894CD|nr:bifunctional enoyl-CoA hydratase/phosphate acetyltransferase [Sediminibacillus massiliensis]